MKLLRQSRLILVLGSVSAFIQTDPTTAQANEGNKAVVQVGNPATTGAPTTKNREGASKPVKPSEPSPLTSSGERAAFSVAPGLEMELVVEEDLDRGYGKFVAVQFDPRGRLWTMTAREYPVDANENAGAADALYASRAQDKILVYDVLERGLEGQAVRYAKEPTVFADGLAIPLGLLPYKDGCFVQHGHDIVFLRDTDGDGKSDKREVILTGFGVQDSHLFPHQFTRAPGGWIWLAQGAFNYSKVVGPDGKLTPFDQTRMAKFRPDGTGFTITGNGPCNIWGLAMNSEGETFIQEANDFGYPVMPFHEHANYPGCSNAQWKSYAPEFPGTADFRMGGTGLSGLALTDAGGSFPPEWSDVMLVANPITNCIQAIKMHRDGSGWRLEKLPDIVTSGDEWFRPVGMTPGPDGAVYIVDWYNKIISHNEVARNHPDRDKKRGRIWRLKGREAKGFGAPDLSKFTEARLVATLGSASVAQSHLAWQTLEDRMPLAAETIALLQSIAASPAKAGSGTGPYPDAARIQALWTLQQSGANAAAAIQSLTKSANRNARREAANSSVAAALELIADSDFEVRIASINRLADDLGKSPGGGEDVSRLITAMLRAAGPALSSPTRASSHSGRTIKSGAAYERDFERYLVRQHLERSPDIVVVFLDSEKAAALSPESLVTACLSLPVRESAPRLARLLTQLGRAANEEEILRLAEAPGDPAVQRALAALITKPEGLQTLLRLKTRFDARVLTPLLTASAQSILADNPDLALQVIAGFTLTDLEPAVAALPPDATTLATLKILGSKRADLFLPLTKSSDPAVVQAALGALVSTPDRLLPLWPELNAAQRRVSLDSLAAQPASASMLVAAILDGRIARDELDGPLVDRLLAVLNEDDSLKRLLDSMTGFLAEVLQLDGTEEAWIDSRISLAGPFTIEAWVKLAPGIGNQDSLIGAPGEIDINFYDNRLRVWAGSGLHDIAVAGKPIIAGAWTHVAVTRDAVGNYQLYLNGEPDAAGTTADPRPYQDLAIARSNVPHGTAGQFTEYRIWNASRSPEEIRAAFDRTGLAVPASSSTAVATTSAALTYYRPSGAIWGNAKPGARSVRTMDFPNLITPDAARALDEKFAHYRALAAKPGDAAKGQILGVICTACHLVNGQGGQIGPNLSGAGAMGIESLLRNILTPNAAMEPGYRVFRAELTDGSISEGFLAAEDDTAIVLRLPGSGDQRIPRDQIRRSAYTKRSLMPEGLELSFTSDQWTDLFAYLKTLR